MKRTFLKSLRMHCGAIALLVGATGCTTDFDLTRLPSADAGRDVVAVDSSDIGGPDVQDVPATDTPPADAPASCGSENQHCCAVDGGSPCNDGALVCTGGYCLRCPGILRLCGSTCVDFSVNPARCGNCETQCATGEVCMGGLCRLPCPSGQAQCGTQCIAYQSDPMHCGAVTPTVCGRACPTPAHAAAICSSGMCGMGACTTGFANCDGDVVNGCETELATSPTNCGACGTSCTFAHATATCAAGTCALGACEPGYANCDGNAANGCEVNTSTALNDCGACGTVCATPMTGSAVCRSGMCGTSTTTCAAGRGNCDGIDANACEADLSADPANCGACGTTCSFAHATATCAAGSCQIGTCQTGFANCDMDPANGCEVDLQHSLASCGSCTNACSAAHGTSECSAGSCQVGACEPGFANCDGLAANGCEVDLNSSTANCGACGIACAPANAVSACSTGICRLITCNAGFADCDGSPTNGCEVNLSSDASNCGACRTVCNVAHATAACTMGACTVGACAMGFGNCDGSANNGCEADLSADPQHCGVCAPACSFAHAAATCAAGACVMGSCAMGFANCDGNVVNGCETDLTTDPTHCGACANACASSQVCTGGSCSVTCGPGLTACSGLSCVDLQTNTTNCRTCGNACPSGPNSMPKCQGGACSLLCAMGFADCDMDPANGCETNLQSSAANCATCGHACSFANAAATCTNGVCGLGTCNTGFANCDMNPANGCEVPTSSNTSNCGACRSTCAMPANSTPTCTNGACGITCSAGFGDCDGNTSNGCETNLRTSTTNCNACGVRCTFANAAASCASGTCALGMCNMGFANCDGMAANGCETDLRNNPNNCGMCGVVCMSSANANPGCGIVSGVTTCRPSCLSGFGNCDMASANGCESNLMTDSNNCGTCMTRCSTGRTCVQGACCSAGSSGCGTTTCFNLLTSTSHCGSCSVRCPDGHACVAGSCV